MASIQIRLPFLLILLHVSVFAAPTSTRSVTSSPPLDNKIALCITTGGITSDVGNGVPDRSLSNVLTTCDGAGSNSQGTLAQALDLTKGQNTLGAVESSLSGDAGTGKASKGLPGSSGINPATVNNPGSVSSHSVHVISGGGSDGSTGIAEVHVTPLGSVLAIGSGGRFGLPIDGHSGGTIPSTTTGPIPANDALSNANPRILADHLGNVAPGSVNSQSLDIVSGGGRSQGSLGSVKVESPVFGSALAIGTSGSNVQNGIPVASKDEKSDSPPNNGPSGENSNGTPNGQNSSGDGRHGQSNVPAKSPNADQNSGANEQAPPSSPPNAGPAPNASNSSPKGSNSTPSDDNHMGTTNHDGNIAEFGVEIPDGAQRLGINGLVRQRNM